jgi:hypothetical protein
MRQLPTSRVLEVGSRRFLGGYLFFAAFFFAPFAFFAM